MLMDQEDAKIYRITKSICDLFLPDLSGLARQCEIPESKMQLRQNASSCLHRVVEGLRAGSRTRSASLGISLQTWQLVSDAQQVQIIVMILLERLMGSSRGLQCTYLFLPVVCSP